MSKTIKGNQRHLTLSDRSYIEQSLTQGISFRQMAITLQKDPSTISKEVKKHRHQPRQNSSSRNDYIHAPFVCNGCDKHLQCKSPHFYYHALQMHSIVVHWLIPEVESTVLLKNFRPWRFSFSSYYIVIAFFFTFSLG